MTVLSFQLGNLSANILLLRMLLKVSVFQLFFCEFCVALFDDWRFFSQAFYRAKELLYSTGICTKSGAFNTTLGKIR